MGLAFRSGLRNVRLWVFLKANGDQIDRERAHIASEKRRRSKIVMTSFSLASKYVWSPFYRRCSVWNNLLEWDVTFTVFPHFGILFQQLNDSLAQIKDQSNMFSIFWTLLTSPDTSTWSFLKKCHILLLDYFDKSFVSCEIGPTRLGIRWCDVSPNVGWVELHKLQI